MDDLKKGDKVLVLSEESPLKREKKIFMQHSFNKGILFIDDYEFDLKWSDRTTFRYAKNWERL